MVFTVDFIDSSLSLLQYFEDTNLKTQVSGEDTSLNTQVLCILEIIKISQAYMSKFSKNSHSQKPKNLKD